MANKTAWVPGSLGSGSLAYQPAFAASDLEGLANGNSVLSTVVFDFTGGLDQFLDISAVIPLAGSETLAAGAGLAFWWAWLQGDGTTYGDGRITAGSGGASSYVPTLDPLPGIAAQAGSSVATVAGDTGLITLRPRKGSLIMQNLTGFAINAAIGTGGVWVSTYRQNMNA